MIKQLRKIKKRYIVLAVVLLIVLVFLIAPSIPAGELADYRIGGEWASMSRGPTYYVKKPNGDLVGWGYNRGTLVDSDYIKWVPFFLPAKVMDDVVTFDTNYFGHMVLDEDGKCWGDGYFHGAHNSLYTLRTETYRNWTLLMEDVVWASMGSLYMAAVKNDGTLMVWGGGKDTPESHVPRKLMDNVRWVEASSGGRSVTVYVLTKANELCAVDCMTGQEMLLLTDIKEKEGPLLLTTSGELLYYDFQEIRFLDGESEYTRFDGGPLTHLMDHVERLTQSGCKLEDGTYMTWDDGELKPSKECGYAIGRYDSLWITDGRYHIGWNDGLIPLKYPLIFF